VDRGLLDGGDGGVEFFHGGCGEGDEAGVVQDAVDGGEVGFLLEHVVVFGGLGDVFDLADFLWFEHGDWAQLSADIHDRGSTRVARRITGAAPGLAPKAGDRASWSSIYYPTPQEARLDARSMTITTPRYLVDRF